MSVNGEVKWAAPTGGEQKLLATSAAPTWPLCSHSLVLTAEVLEVLRVRVRLVGLRLGRVVVELLVVQEVLGLLVVVVAEVLEVANRREAVDATSDVLLERDLGCKVSLHVQGYGSW